MNLEDEYLRLSDVELKLENSKRQLDDRLRKVRIEMDAIKAKIIEEFLEDGVVPFNLTIKKVPPKPIVTDESKVPNHFWKLERKLDKAGINATIKNGYQIDGVSMDNGSYTVILKAIKDAHTQKQTHQE